MVSSWDGSAVPAAKTRFEADLTWLGRVALREKIILRRRPLLASSQGPKSKTKKKELVLANWPRVFLYWWLCDMSDRLAA